MNEIFRDEMQAWTYFSDIPINRGQGTGETLATSVSYREQNLLAPEQSLCPEHNRPCGVSVRRGWGVAGACVT